MNKQIHIIGGGTVFHVRPHLALCAPAYGKTARDLYERCRVRFDKMDVNLHLTKMAGGKHLETNQDVSNLLGRLVEEPSTKVIFLPAALCDYEGAVGGEAGKGADRLKTDQGRQVMDLIPAEKVVRRVREKRKDIFLVAFKTTSGATEDEQYLAALGLLKGASCNLVLANDLKTRTCMIVTPEEARYHITRYRDEALDQLVDMTWHRSHLTFTRSTVVAGDPVPWSDPAVPASLREIVNHCISEGAYKPFRGATVGHFAARLDDQTFLTSIRKTNFNDLDRTGLVRVQTDGHDTVLAYGAKPSVGGQSQRILFDQHPQFDCVVHFHCPKRPDSVVPTVSQREFECGSHQCGQNTSSGIRYFQFAHGGYFGAVYLDEHGPNIIFNSKTVNVTVLKDFIDKEFDLSKKTGGYVS